MQDYLEIGSTPAAEPCAQVGSPDYHEKARPECRRFIAQLRKQFGDEPLGAKLAIKMFPHEFGGYHEVVCYFDDEFPESVEYAFKCESEAWENWRD